MIRPNRIQSYPEIDLKLGIKSSLPNIKSTIALWILLWKASNRPATLEYSVVVGDGIALQGEIEEELYNYLKSQIPVTMTKEELHQIVIHNQMFISQLESLMVAFELVWKLGKITFQEQFRPASAERTGGVRYPKVISYSANMDLIHLLMSQQEERYMAVLLHWLEIDVAYDQGVEENLLELLTLLSEGAVYKLNDQGNDIVFQQDGIYERLLQGSKEVDVSGDKEAKGSLRILKASLSDEMNPYLRYRSGQVTVSEEKKEQLVAYQKRVATYLSMSTSKVLTKDESKNELTQYQIQDVLEGIETEVKTEKHQSDVTEDKNQQQFISLDDNAETAESSFNNNQLFKDNKTWPMRSPRMNTLHPMNQIIYGAPGTGKTYSSVEYALAILENRPVDLGKKSKDERKALMDLYESYKQKGQIVFTTFHQSYGYEEFIQGIRPTTINGSMSFQISDGVFKIIADRAMEHPELPYVIIIDEINRGNISKIFGELITLIEEDKRYGELNQLSVSLPMGEEFAVPNNLYILGTMNSADKSISLIDTAIRRRFSFLEMAPDETVVDNPVLRKVLSDLNSYLKKELRSTDLLIGHSFFVGRKERDLGDIMNRNIIPLLYEYFYEDEGKVKKALACLDGSGYIIDTEYRGRVRVVYGE